MMRTNESFHRLAESTFRWTRYTALLMTAWLGPAASYAQTPLTLEEALGLALAQNPSMEAVAAARDASEARRAEARAKLLPRVDYVESVTRSDNPVFVFGTLLTQERFGEENFAIDSLNRPDALNLFRSQLVLEQTVFDGAQNLLGLRRAGLGVDLAQEVGRRAEMDIIFETVRAYYGALVSEENLRVVQSAVDTADADLRRAQSLYDSGLVTEADLLSLRVHRASLLERRIRARNLRDLALAELNVILGEPVERSYRLLTPLEPLPDSMSSATVETWESTAIEQNPDARQKALEERMADVGRRMATYRFLPSVSVNAGWESDRVSFSGDGGTNWMVGVALRLNLFRGLGDRAGLAAAEAELRRARAERRKKESEVRLEVRRAVSDLEAAGESERVTSEAVSQARESHRITQARYEAGLADVTDLLRSQTALVEAEAGHLRAVYEGRLAAVRLELVAGTLERNAEVLRP